MKYIKRMTFEEWERFNVPAHTDRPSVNTRQEILLQKYKIIITGHTTKKHVWVRYPEHKRRHRVRIPPLFEQSFTEKLKEIPKHITQENFDKGMKKFDNGMNQFNKAVQTFSSGLGEFEKEAKRDQVNLKKLMGKSKKSQVKIWSDKPKKTRKRKRKTKSDSWDQHEKNLEKLWGNKN